MVSMAGLKYPIHVIRDQMASTLDLLVHIARMTGGRRKIVSIAEVSGMEGEVILMQDLFTFDYNTVEDSSTPGKLVATGITPNFTDQLKDHGVDLSSEHFRLPWGK